MLYFIIFIATIFLAYSNGANDNFKGVSTLFGSGTASFKKALNWATFTTALGSITSIFFASILVKNFSGKGLVPDEFLSQPQFAIAVALGGAVTVMMATKIGMPISTTHALVGSLTGVGLIAVGNQFNFDKLINSFFFPLIASPFIAALFSLLLYYIFTSFRKRFGVTKESCVCFVKESSSFLTNDERVQSIVSSTEKLIVKTGTLESCTEIYAGNIVGFSAQRVLDVSHYISAGAVCFARGLNDTPKMVGLLLLISTLDIRIGGMVIALAIILGGLINSQKVGETMSKKITKMNHGQGFTANLITALLVSTASVNGLPVSTTHVSVGSLLGIGVVTRSSNLNTVKNILLSWVLTLPFAALIGAGTYLIIKSI